MLRRVAILVTSALLAGALSACAEVKPWERGTLSLPPMDPQSTARAAKKQFVRHTFDVREGSTGGDEEAGGGCGCN